MDEYGSFAQSKGLRWRGQFDAILRGDLLPPVGAALDLTDSCNLKCRWCNSRSYRSPAMLSKDAAVDGLMTLARMGVKSVCFAGGGEPLLHPDFATLVVMAKELGMEVGISTNGTLLDRKTAQVIAGFASFCGVSVDAGSAATYRKLKGGDLSKMLPKLRYLTQTCKMLGRCQTTFKFMLTKDNYTELGLAQMLSDELHFDKFYARPPADANPEDYEDMDYYWLSNANVSRMEAEPADKCRATPVFVCLAADGWCYPCPDLRHKRQARMCRHSELEAYWNSPKHHALLSRLPITKVCPRRCAFTHYNRQLQAVKEGRLYENFP